MRPTPHRVDSQTTNVAPLRRGPRVDVPMGEDLIHIVGKMQDMGPHYASIDEHPTYSFLARPTGPRDYIISSHSTRMTMIPLARVRSWRVDGHPTTSPKAIDEEINYLV
ncbi:hypothetical protein H5410_021397 [Solanum commersonii]|uniref:Uncharacterized protein n=1 Tax=Solanum commersonii TaxID=4109 RepID=A0A9J5ZF09_SOLCO|nr:hypothetical protein H5410_021397 [Solanum commersonii]